MSTCKNCGKSGLFLKVSPIGLCGNCEQVVTMDIERRAQIIGESTEIIVQSPNTDTILRRFDFILENLKYLRKYEEKGIQTLVNPPSESLKSFTPEDRDKIIVYGLEKEFERVKEKIQTLKSEEAKVRNLENFFKRCDSYLMELNKRNSLQRIQVSVNEQIVAHKKTELPKSTDKGKISYYSLDKWYLSTFTDDERTFMEERYIDRITLTKNLAKGYVKTCPYPLVDFLKELESWFWNVKTPVDLGERIQKKLFLEFEKASHISIMGIDKEFVVFRDFKTIMEEEGVNEEEAKNLSWVEEVEAKDKYEKTGVPTAPYERLAILYRKNKDIEKEYEILRRFTRQRPNSGASSIKLIERIFKVKAIMEQQGFKS